MHRVRLKSGPHGRIAICFVERSGAAAQRVAPQCRLDNDITDQCAPYAERSDVNGDRKSRTTDRPRRCGCTPTPNAQRLGTPVQCAGFRRALHQSSPDLSLAVVDPCRQNSDSFGWFRTAASQSAMTYCLGLAGTARVRVPARPLMCSRSRWSERDRFPALVRPSKSRPQPLIVQKLHDALHKILKNNSLRDKFAELGVDPMEMEPADLDTFGAHRDRHQHAVGQSGAYPGQLGALMEAIRFEYRCDRAGPRSRRALARMH